MAAVSASPPSTCHNPVSDPKLQLPSSCDPPSPTNPPQQRVWIIFGATGHLGRSIVKAALAHDDLVAAVGQTCDDSIENMEALFKPTGSLPSSSSAPVNGQASISHNASQFTSPDSPPQPQRFLPLICDVRVRSTIDLAFQSTLTLWGRYDIVANCAGYGVIGPAEEQDEHTMRGQMETNFWGTLNIVQLSLPYFRTRGENVNRAHGEDEEDRVGEEGEEYGEDGWGGDDANEGEGGRYLIFSSTSGALGVPGLGPYCATKYAIEGLVESLLYETAGFHVRATLVEPGHVRRDDPPASADDVGKKSEAVVTKAANGKVEKMALPAFGHFSVLQSPPGSVYANPTSPAHHARRVVQWLGDRQPTSAFKGAELVWQLGHCRFPPLRLLLGAFAVESVRERMRGLTEEIEDWKNLSFPVEGLEDKEAASPAKVKRKGSRNEAPQDGKEDVGDGDGDEDVKMEEIEEANDV